MRERERSRAAEMPLQTRPFELFLKSFLKKSVDLDSLFLLLLESWPRKRASNSFYFSIPSVSPFSFALKMHAHSLPASRAGPSSFAAQRPGRGSLHVVAVATPARPPTSKPPKR